MCPALTVHTMIVDDLHFEIRRSQRRRALEIVVGRGGELSLAARPRYLKLVNEAWSFMGDGSAGAGSPGEPSRMVVGIFNMTRRNSQADRA